MRTHALAVKNSLLMSKTDAAIVEALATYADEGTWHSVASIEMIAALARVDPKTVRRRFDVMASEEHDGFLQMLRRPRGGQNAVWVIRVHWERIIPVAKAVARARRLIMGGAVRMAETRGWLHKPANNLNCAGMISAMQQGALLEGEHGASRKIMAYLDTLTEAVTEWPHKALIGSVDSAELACAKQARNLDMLFGNLDTLSDNLDIPSSAYNKDNSPQGESSTHAPAREVDLRLASIAALAIPGGERRKELMTAIVGCQLAVLDGWLVFRAASKSQCDYLHGKFWNDLFAAARGKGFAGIVISDRSRPDADGTARPADQLGGF